MASAWIDTERLGLRPCGHDDVDALHGLWTDPDVRRYLWDDVVISQAATVAAVDASVTSFGTRGFGLWTIQLTAGIELIGFCGLRPSEDADDIELLYGLAPAYWRRGLATEAARAVLRYGFETAHLERIVAATDAPNVESARVLERLGMRYEGRTPMPETTLLHFALTAASFQPGTSPYRLHLA